MKVTRCRNGHYFDGGRYKVCPHCKGQESLDNNFYTSHTQLYDDCDNTSISNDDITQIHKITFKPSPTNYESESTAAISKDNNAIRDYKGTQNGEKPVVLCNFNLSKNESGFASSTVKRSPVVGWLVCVSGVDRGLDYRLHVGRNFVGRSLDMDVSIPYDAQLSEQDHFSVVYDNRSYRFIAVPSEGNDTFLNGVLLHKPMDLKDGDIIKCGVSELCFTGFCKKGREW